MVFEVPPEGVGDGEEGTFEGAEDVPLCTLGGSYRCSHLVRISVAMPLGRVHFCYKAYSKWLRINLTIPSFQGGSGEYWGRRVLGFLEVIRFGGCEVEHQDKEQICLMNGIVELQSTGITTIPKDL